MEVADTLEMSLRATSEENLKPVDCEIRSSAGWFFHLKRGDHVAVHRDPHRGVGHWHHGIFLGDNAVIEFGPRNVRPVRISGEVFFGGHLEYATVRYDKDSAFAAHIAELFERDAFVIEQYHLIDDHCEVLASICKTGKVQTEQIDKMLDAAAKAYVRIIKYKF